MEVKDFGFIVAAAKYNDTHYIVQILTQEHGKWAGMHRTINTPMISSYVYMTWKGKAGSLGNLRYECLNAAASIHFWQDKFILATVSAICSAASKFIPDRIPGREDFEVLEKAFTTINSTNYLEILMNWEDHILSKHFGQILSKSKDIKSHIYSTKHINTPQRLDLIALLNLCA